MKINIAEVLHLAADKCLAVDDIHYWFNNFGYNGEKYSCCAISNALEELIDVEESWFVYEESLGFINEGLEAMGCDVGSTNLFPSSKIKGDYINIQSQQDRYFWLKWAALMAEEQGAVYES
jgi:hypothetical protein